MPSTKDLSTNLDFTFTLLRSTGWKLRLVERIELASSTKARASSHYQVEFPPELIGEFAVGDFERANVILPVTTRPKRPLLRFRLQGPQGAPVSLLPRASIAEIEAEHLRILRDDAALTKEIVDGLPLMLLEAVCLFTPGVYDAVRGGDGYLSPLRNYLSHQLPFRVTLTDVLSWRRDADAAGQVLVSALGEPPDPRSSSECVLLALPAMRPPPASPEKIAELVSSYRMAIEAARDEGAWDLLQVLGEYGRRWELLAEVEVPLRRPADLVVAEDRPLGLEAGGWSRQHVTFRDANSTHVEISVLDPNVSIRDYRVQDLGGRLLRFPPLEGAEQTEEVVSIYSSDSQRPYFADFCARLQPADYIRWTALATCVVTASAAVVAAFVDSDQSLIEKLTLLTLPTTITATLMLVREATTLATRLIRGLRILLAIALVGLWLVVLVRVSLEGLDAGWLGFDG
jgi:hypothetical protein